MTNKTGEMTLGWPGGAAHAVCLRQRRQLHPPLMPRCAPPSALQGKARLCLHFAKSQPLIFAVFAKKNARGRKYRKNPCAAAIRCAATRYTISVVSVQRERHPELQKMPFGMQKEAL